MCVQRKVEIINPWVPRAQQVKIRQISFNPLVLRVQKIKIRYLTLNRLLIVEIAKKIVYLGAHYSERQGLMGWLTSTWLDL